MARLCYFLIDSEKWIPPYVAIRLGSIHNQPFRFIHFQGANSY